MKLSLVVAVIILGAVNVMLVGQHSADMAKLHEAQAALEELLRADAVLKDADSRLKASADKAMAANAALEEADTQLKTSCRLLAERVGLRLP